MREKTKHRKTISACVDEDLLEKLRALPNKQDAINEALRVFFYGLASSQSIPALEARKRELEAEVKGRAEEIKQKEAEVSEALAKAERVTAEIMALKRGEDFRNDFLREANQKQFEDAVRIVGRAGNKERAWELAVIHATALCKRGFEVTPIRLVQVAFSGLLEERRESK